MGIERIEWSERERDRLKPHCAHEVKQALSLRARGCKSTAANRNGGSGGCSCEWLPEAPERSPGGKAQIDSLHGTDCIAVGPSDRGKREKTSGSWKPRIRADNQIRR